MVGTAPVAVRGFSLVSKGGSSVSKLLEIHADDVKGLKEEAASRLAEGSMSERPYCNDVFFLRYCVDDEAAGEDGSTTLRERLAETLKWREGPGSEICHAAIRAVEEATSSGKWNNDPVMSNAPHSSTIQKFLNDRNMMTTTMASGDLVYCIRAGQIDDNELTSELGVENLSDFFLYAKEVNALVANDRSLESDRLLGVLTANDLDGVKLIGGSADFRKALSLASKRAEGLYPATAGPSLLLNLPRLVNALVKLFTPLFPPSVNARLKFAKSETIKSVPTLRDLSTNGGSAREAFLDEIDGILGA